MVLSDDGRLTLTRLARRGTVARRTALRARIVPACAGGADNRAAAAGLRVTAQTVGKWRRRFVYRRLDGLLDEPRCGAPQAVTDDRVEAVVVRTLESTPKGQTRWSTRGMATAAEQGRSTVGRIWQAFGLKPHLSETFKLSPDPQFVEKVRDVIGLYMSPPGCGGRAVRRREGPGSGVGPDPAPAWAKTADDILASVERFANRALGNHPAVVTRTSRQDARADSHSVYERVVCHGLVLKAVVGVCRGRGARP